MNYIVFDLEATCWENDRSRLNEIIEIGAVKINDSLEIIEEFQTFIKPKLNPQLSEFCTRLTSIEQKDTDSAPSFTQAARHFLDWIGDEPYVLCSWGLYDKKQLTSDCRLHNFRTDWLNRHISIKHQHGTLIGRSRGVGMGKALEMLKLPLVGTHHRGIDDARNIAKIFITIFDQLDFE
jgi:3'-5' exoribonuclease 1